jgi:curved DNA-binding protein CbpA
MASPTPQDPYEALGVSADADISAIRTAHRKLVLKHHPDRIKDPTLKERGKDEFQKIQQAYELLSDPVQRSRYDDKVKLAELRKETMMRDPPRHQAYPMRPAAHSASSSREWNTDDHAFYETRRPRNTDFDSKEKFEPPNRTTSRKHAEYERASTAKKPSERSDRSAKATWGVATEAVKFGIRVKKDAEKTKTSKAHQSKQEMRDREKRQARMDKDRRAHVVDEADSDSDTATRVTSSTIRPSKSVPRPARGSEHSSARSSGAHARRAYTDDDSDTGTYVSMKWEMGHYEGAKEYMEKAAAGSGNRPSIGRGDSYWSSRKSGSDSEKRPTSSRGRRPSYDEPPLRPPMPQQNSSPGNLKTRVEERAPKERRSATGPYPEHRQGMPSFSRSQTMPAPRPSTRDAAPSKSSNLKHTETQDSGYGSSSSPHTPEMREESPPRRSKPVPSKPSTKYQIVDPTDSDDDRRTTIRVLPNEPGRRRYQRSPERDRREPERKRKDDRPDTTSRSKSSRDIPTEPPKPRRAESAKYHDETRSSRESPRESPSLSRHGSGRERARLFAEYSDEDGKPYRFKYPSGENINMRSPYDPQFAKYRESSDRRNYDHNPGPRFPESFPSSRRPSVQAHG